MINDISAIVPEKAFKNNSYFIVFRQLLTNTDVVKFFRNQNIIVEFCSSLYNEDIERNDKCQMFYTWSIFLLDDNSEILFKLKYGHLFE